jgi:molybdopterin synthase catalytic subunit
MSGAPVQEPSKKLHVALVAAPIDVAALHDEVADDGAGATLLFVGTVRNEKEARRVTHIDYEAYATMALRRLQAIAGEIAARWPVRRVALVHRVGRLEVGDASIAIVLSTPHRAEGFEALRFGIESVKKDVPIWKKEHFQDGAVWVQEGS